MFCWGSQTPKQTLVCIWPALLPIVSARSIAVILSEDFRRLNLNHCCDVFGLVADRGRKRTEPCRWSTLRPRTSQWSQYDSIWMRTAKCLQGMTTATSKKESSCFPPCEGYESNNADLSSTANQGVIAGANTTNIGFTPLPHMQVAMQLARSPTVKLVVLVQEDFQIDQKDSVASAKSCPCRKAKHQSRDQSCDTK